MPPPDPPSNLQEPPSRARERELVLGLLRRDPEAVRVFVATWGPVVRQVVVRDFGLDEAEAKDVFQRVFERLWEDDMRRLRQWAGRGSLAGWLRTIARRIVVDELRRRGREVPTGDDMDPEAGARDPAWPWGYREPEPGELRDREDLADCIREALEHLRERDRRLLQRRHWEEQSYAEIAEAEGMTANAVGVALLRAERRAAAWVERLCGHLLGERPGRMRD